MYEPLDPYLDDYQRWLLIAGGAAEVVLYLHRLGMVGIRRRLVPVVAPFAIAGVVAHLESAVREGIPRHSPAAFFGGVAGATVSLNSGNYDATVTFIPSSGQRG